jgi:hypothetical protein
MVVQDGSDGLRHFRGWRREVAQRPRAGCAGGGGRRSAAAATAGRGRRAAISLPLRREFAAELGSDEALRGKPWGAAAARGAPRRGALRPRGVDAVPERRGGRIAAAGAAPSRGLITHRRLNAAAARCRLCFILIPSLGSAHLRLRLRGLGQRLSVPAVRR